MTDLKFALRSLARARGLTFTVVLTLALGIGANAAIFSVVRGVLLRPLVNRDADRLIYIRQSAKGIGMDNARFSVPELRDLQARVKTVAAFGDFSTIEFTMLGLGDRRSAQEFFARFAVFPGKNAFGGHSHSLNSSAITAIAASSSLVWCAAEGWTRRRAAHFGTIGKVMA